MVVSLKWNSDKSNSKNEGYCLEETLVESDCNGKCSLSNEKFNGSSMEFKYTALSHALNVSKLRNKVTCAAIKAGAQGDILGDISIAAGEALTNAYSHEASDNEKCMISVKCDTDFKQFIIEIEDEDEDYDFDPIEDPDIYLMKYHGMGIYIMRKTMDNVSFSNEGKGNKVRMTKKIKTLETKSHI